MVLTLSRPGGQGAVVDSDNIVSCWIELRESGFGFSIPMSTELDAYDALLSQLLPVPSRLDSVDSVTAGRLTPYGARSISSMYERILDCYHAYRTGNYLAPYACLIEPSGIGKTFAISQMAVVHDLYQSTSLTSISCNVDLLHTLRDRKSGVSFHRGLPARATSNFARTTWLWSCKMSNYAGILLSSPAAFSNCKP